MSEKVKIPYRAAIIGVSGFGHTHYGDLMREVEAGNCQIIAATVINQDEEAEKCAKLKELGATLYTDYNEMLEKHRGEIDLCCVPTGISMHAPMSIAAMRSGANVFVEKPVAATVQEVAEMQRVEQETNKFCAVGYQHVYLPNTHQTKELIMAGGIGKLQAIRVKGLWPRDEKYYNRNNWAGAIRSGDYWVLDSPFNNALAHYLNLACFLAGDSFEKSAQVKAVQAELYRGNKIENADTACIKVITSNDVEILFIVSHCSSASDGPEFSIIGDKASLQGRHDAISGIAADGSKVDFPVLENREDFRVCIFDAIRARLLDDQAFYCSLDIAGTQTICANGAHESSRVNPFPAEICHRIPTDNDSFRTVVDGLDSAIDKCFDEGKMFSELGVDWAVPGDYIDMVGYNCFNGGKCL
jgi:predicted dehydrogenase